jgi:asparagine synthetase B (glutamine-hydrolysing)
MLENEPSWLAVLGPPSHDEENADPSATEVASSDGEGSFRLRIHRGGSPAEGPVLAWGNRHAVLLDGFLHDRTHLEGTLACSPHRAKTDADLILAAFRDLGDRMLPLLRGSFALVAWDGRDGSILCARDLTGSHPLFFSQDGERVLVGASHGALLEVGRVRADVDRIAIARWVQTGSSSPRRTFYERIQRLPPGYALRAGPEGVRIWRYWKPGDAARADDLSPEEALERFEELLDQAVARSASLGRLGIFLSGGVDSAAVAASATAVSHARSLPDPLALSYVYPDPEASEETTQRTVATALGIPLRIVSLNDTVGREGLLLAALRLSERSWTPPVNPWEPAFVHLAAEGARRGCRVIISGEGGNDWFEAERDEAADLLRHLKLAELGRLWSAERQAGRKGLDSARALLWDSGARVLFRDAGLMAARAGAGGMVAVLRRRRVRSWIPRGWFLPEVGLRSALEEEWLGNPAVDRRGSFRASAQARRLDGVHLVVPVENRFLYGRSVGVDFANPAVDPDLVEFLFGLPRSLLNLGGRGKGLAVESVRRRAGVTASRALGFAWLEGYSDALFDDESSRALEAIGGLTRLSELGIVDEQAFVRGFRRAGLGKKMSYYQAWQILACEAWLRSRV